MLSSTTVQTANRTQYHIDCKPGDLAEYVMLVGDPDRIGKIAKRLTDIRFQAHHREYVTITGKYKGIDLSIMATGIGNDNTEIAVIEICQITQQPTFIRCGSCGALQENIRIGDLVISTGSVRYESTTSHFVCDGYPAIAHQDVVTALTMACHQYGYPLHVGITASASGFYGAQSRKIPGFHVRQPHLLDELRSMNVLNMEMETSTLFVLSALRKVRAGAVCAVYANRVADEMGSELARLDAEEKCIEASLEAFFILSQIDMQRKKSSLPIWVPQEIL